MPEKVSARFDSLESRELLSTVKLSDNILTVRADNGINNVIVVREGRGAKMFVSINGGVETSYNDTDVNAVVVFGGTGNDYIAISQRLREFTTRTTFVGGPGNDTLVGGNGRSELISGTGDDLLMGGDADNTLVGGTGRDTLLGGSAFDLIIAGRGHTYINGGRGQNILFGGTRGDTIIGGDFRDEIFGSPSDDVIILGSGDETVWGNGGSDSITGSTGGNNEVHRSTFKNLTKLIRQLFPDIPT